MPKFYAPYKKFRTVVDGITLYFPGGTRFVPDDNKRELAAIKKIPLALGEITNAAGQCVNAPKPKPTKPKAAPEEKAQPKPKPKAEPKTD